jgi:hypothetical protein
VTAQYSSDSYQGIIDALNTVRAANGEDRKSYIANYRGIIDAILDLQKWGQAGSGPLPPGLYPITDEDGNIIGTDFNPPPANGTLWFDQRQGRLFIWMDDGFYQTNGADGLPAFQEQPPETEVPGALWYNEVNGVLYIYSGTTWTAVGGVSGAVNTAGLMLANPTRSALGQISTRLPDSSGMTNQADMNKWTVNALTELDTLQDGISEGIPTFNINSTKPTTGVRGDFWFNTNKVELMMFYDGKWVPTSLPLLANDDFTQLAGIVNTNHASSTNKLIDAAQRLRALENAPLRQLQIDTDYNSKSIVLNDSEGSNSSVEFKGINGINVTANYGCVTIDGELLRQSVENLVATSGTASAITSLTARTLDNETSIAALISETKVTPLQFEGLQQIVDLLPTRSELNQKVGMNDAVFSADISLLDNRITDVALPAAATDAANKQFVDLLRTYVDNTFVSKSGSTLNNISIQKSDANSPAIDFSGSPVNGLNAFKFKTFGGNGSASFGVTVNPNEYAWEFTGDEEFSWIGSSGKSATINNDGITTKSLTLGTFYRNDNNQQLVLNKIDVKERLTTYQTALQDIRSALVTATDFDEFKSLAHSALSNI